MKIRTKRILMVLLLLAGIIWDCLCIWNVFPLSLFTVSIVAVCGYLFMILFIPLLFPGNVRAGENSTYMHDLTENEKRMSFATICLAFAWIVTLLICIAYPV